MSRISLMTWTCEATTAAAYTDTDQTSESGFKIKMVGGGEGGGSLTEAPPPVVKSVYCR